MNILTELLRMLPALLIFLGILGIAFYFILRRNATYNVAFPAVAEQLGFHYIEEGAATDALLDNLAPFFCFRRPVLPAYKPWLRANRMAR